MTVEGKDAYCIDINTGFKNKYRTWNCAKFFSWRGEVISRVLMRFRIGRWPFFHSFSKCDPYFLFLYEREKKMELSAIWHHLNVNDWWGFPTIGRSVTVLKNRPMTDSMTIWWNVWKACGSWRIIRWGITPI